MSSGVAKLVLAESKGLKPVTNEDLREKGVDCSCE